MPSLAELQSEFRRFIIGDGPPGPGLTGVLGDGLDPAALLSIYRNNTVISLTEALATTFPVVVRLVDRRFFDFAADSFIKDNLPTSRCLSEYGRNFPAFLSVFTPAAGLPYLPEVAELEWLISRLRVAEPLPPISVSALLEIVEFDFERIVFHIDPTIGYFVSRFPVDSIWMDNQPDAPSVALSPRTGDVHLEVHAHQGVRLGRLDPAVWHFRSRVARGEALGDALQNASRISNSFDLAQALAALFQESCVIGISV
jgi:hypothetical protein